MQYLTQSEETKVFDFITNDFKLKLAAYPIWEASVSGVESNLWVKVIPEIDLSQKVIYCTRKSKLSKKTTPLSSNSNNNKNTESLSLIKSEEFFDSIPKNIRVAVSKFSDSHWEIVKAIKLVGKDLLSLIKINPALAYTIVNIEKINPSFACFTNIDVLHRLIRTRHKEILGLIGFPESNRITKIFAKIEPFSINIKNIIALKNSLLLQPEITENILKLLSYAKTINSNLLRLVTLNYTILKSMTHKLIFDLVDSENYDALLESLNETLSCSKQLKRPIPQLVSQSSINRTNAELRKELKSRIKRNIIFPPAPIKGNDYIQPIRNESELKIWAQFQHNCISSYVNKIHCGKSYLYRVVYGKEEATLEIKLRNKKIRLNSLLGKSNRRVSNELKKVIDNWLNEYRYDLTKTLKASTN